MLYYLIGDDNIIYYSGSEFTGSTSASSMRNLFQSKTKITHFKPVEGATQAVLDAAYNNMQLAFSGCTALEYADMSLIYSEGTTSGLAGTFNNCKKL